MCSFLVSQHSGLMRFIFNPTTLAFVTEAAAATKLGPPFETIHDFRTAPRPNRIVAGYSKDDFLRGEKVAFQKSKAGTVFKLEHDTATSQHSNTSFAEMVRGPRGSSYAASWLTTTDILLNTTRFSEQVLQKGGMNLEHGHFAMSNANTEIQTVDMLDFFVHHLSYYQKIMGESHVFTKDVIELLQRMELGYEEHNFYNNPSKKTNGQTLAVLPFFAANWGTSKSGLAQRRHYLNVTVKTVSAIFPNIAIFVTNAVDFEYVTEQSGLNKYLYDVYFIKDMDNPTLLTFGSTVKAKSLIQNGTYTGFDFIFYTETDQIPHLRDVDFLLYNTLQSNTSVVIPHRGRQPVGLIEDASNSTYRRNAKFSTKQH